jgi:hypothetical protein
MAEISYRRHRFPPGVIQYAVWLYLRFTLSYRDVEELLAERGLDISYETVRSHPRLQPLRPQIPIAGQPLTAFPRVPSSEAFGRRPSARLHASTTGRHPKPFTRVALLTGSQAYDLHHQVFACCSVPVTTLSSARLPQLEQTNLPPIEHGNLGPYS